MTAIHISSLLVRCRPEMREQVVRKITEFPFAEIAINDPSGKIVVTMETPSEAEIADAMVRIQLFDGVANAALVFHQMAYPTDPQGAPA